MLVGTTGLVAVMLVTRTYTVLTTVALSLAPLAVGFTHIWPRSGAAFSLASAVALVSSTAAYGEINESAGLTTSIAVLVLYLVYAAYLVVRPAQASTKLE